MTQLPPKGPNSKYRHTGDEAAKHEFGGSTNIQFITITHRENVCFIQMNHVGTLPTITHPWLSPSTFQLCLLCSHFILE